jgi:hypothetical protein
MTGHITDVDVVAARLDGDAVVTALVDKVCELNVPGVDGIFRLWIRSIAT